jgi:hypothetical protein
MTNSDVAGLRLEPAVTIGAPSSAPLPTRVKNMPAEPSTEPTAPVSFSSLAHLLEHRTNHIPDAPVILAPGRAPPTSNLAQARHNYEQATDCRLRFIRSSSAPLPPHVITELERSFGAP